MLTDTTSIPDHFRGSLGHYEKDPERLRVFNTKFVKECRRMLTEVTK